MTRTVTARASKPSDSYRRRSGKRVPLFARVSVVGAVAAVAMCVLSGCSGATTSSGKATSGQCSFDGRVVVIQGDDVACDDVQKTLDEYLSRRDDEGGGNARVLDVNNWVCNSPTAAVAEADHAEAECSRRDNDGHFMLKSEE